MGKHAYRGYCVICGKVRLPFGRSLCSRCLATLPGLPKVTDDDPPRPRPVIAPATKP